jgi:hypothetical protein
MQHNVMCCIEDVGLQAEALLVAAALPRTATAERKASRAPAARRDARSVIPGGQNPAWTPRARAACR